MLLLFGGLGSDVFSFGMPMVNGTSPNTGVDQIADFKVMVDGIRLADGVTITSRAQSQIDADGVLDATLMLSNGGSVQLMGVGPITDWNMLVVA